MTQELKRALAVLWLAISMFLVISCTNSEGEHAGTTSDPATTGAPAGRRPMDTPASGESRPASWDESSAGSQPSSVPSMRELSRTLEAAGSCRRAESLREMLASNPMGDPQPHISLVEAERKCSQVPGAQDVDMEALALRAAKLGNINAASCFASGALRPSQSSGAQRARADQLYRDEAPALIELGIVAGSWTTVGVASGIYAPRSAHSPRLALDAPDPVKHYTYVKLMELGAEGDEKLDLQLAALMLSREIDETKREEADRLAQQMYDSYFQGSGPYSHERTTLCVDF